MWPTTSAIQYAGMQQTLYGWMSPMSKLTSMLKLIKRNGTLALIPLFGPIGGDPRDQVISFANGQPPSFGGPPPSSQPK
jgi:hypothetical protein